MTAVLRSRAERHAEIAALRERGLTGAEIARHLGLSSQFVYEILRDPSGARARARKEKHRRPCPRCGELMTGCNGSGPAAPTFCARCAPDANRIWTRENVIAAIQEYAASYGLPPSAAHWNPGLAPDRADLAVAFEAHTEWPAYATVYYLFGSWANAIEAAGFPRPRPGYYRTENAA